MDELPEDEYRVLLELYNHQNRPDGYKGMDTDLLGRKMQGILYRAIRVEIVGLEVKGMVSRDKTTNLVVITRLGESYVKECEGKKLTNNRIITIFKRWMPWIIVGTISAVAASWIWATFYK